MNSLNIVIGLAVLVWILYRQLTPRLVKASGRAPLVLAIVGVASAFSYLNAHPVAPADVVAVVVGLVVAAALAWPRAMSMTLWQDAQGQWWRRGNWRTIVLWFVAIGFHFGIAALLPRLLGAPAGDTAGAGFEQATLTLYLAVSLGLQSWFRARRLPAGARPTARPRVPAGR